MTKVILVEDDELIFSVIRPLLGSYLLERYSDSQTFVDQIGTKSADLILLDLCSPSDPNGARSISLIPEIKARFPFAEIVIQSGISDVSLMRSCIQKGATRFILKDHLAQELPNFLARFDEIQTQKEKLNTLIIGESDVMRALKAEISHLRLYSSLDVLIEGETGSGKELCAQALHLDGPFVAVNASAIPEDLFEAEFFGSEKGAFTGSVQARAGYFENAASGTLFIDEIQNISFNHQAKLLRVLETRSFKRVGSSLERPFRGRVVCASNKNLFDLVNKGQFREDLYYRIGGLKLRVPPLKVRGQDIEILAKCFLKDFDVSKKKAFTNEGLEFLRNSYDWPGNVRELRHFIRRLVLQNPIPFLDATEMRALLLSDESALSMQSTPSKLDSDSDFKILDTLGFDENIARLEKYLLQNALKKSGSTEARQKLKMARSRFYDKLKEYEILPKSDGASS